MPGLFFQCKIYTWLCAQVLKPCDLPVHTRNKQNLHSFIVASFNAQSVKGNDMACKRCEISTFIKDNGGDLFL